MKRLPALGLFLCLAIPAVAGPEESAVQVARATFVEDESQALGLRSAFGSGTIVWEKDGKALVLTCRHVAPDANGMVWVKIGNVLHGAEWVGVSEKSDLALLRITLRKDQRVRVAVLADAEPAAGAGLRQWGHPKARPAKARAGPALGADDSFKSEDGTSIHTARYPCEGGDSGAGVFDPSDKLVGVCCCRFDLFPDRTGYVPLSEVRKFLEDHTRGK